MSGDLKLKKFNDKINFKIFYLKKNTQLPKQFQVDH
jgi:hypothetical protein